MYTLMVEKAKWSELFKKEDCETETTVSSVEDSGIESIAFSAGNPRVEHVTGVVHLLRDLRETNHASEANTSTRTAERSSTLCCLGLPEDMSVANFCSFCGAYLAEMAEMRVLRREGSQRSVSMVLLYFRTQEIADSFFDDFNGKPFSLLEPEVLCRLVYVKGVQLLDGIAASQPDAAPGTGLTELPSCPVCLERLDEHISGVVTTVCNHRFHGDCLRKWADSSCPVCRYCMQSASTTSRCAQCGSQSNLWICLICGHIGCGRYKDGHARAHWEGSAHCYAMELETQRVWDYAGDGYVHRLIQSKTDGKLVEVPSPGPPWAASRRQSEAAECAACSHAARADPDPEEEQLKEAALASKLDAIALEYNHLLTSQLESQRHYYEGLLQQQEQAAAVHVGDALQGLGKAEAAAAEALLQQREAERKRAAAEKKLAELQSGLARVSDEKEFLRSLNDTLLANQKEFKAQLAAAQQQLEAKGAEVAELQEQVRDLMVFIEAQRTIAGNGSELAEASLLPVPVQQQKGRRRSSRR